jgi:hypothetical protein
MVACVAYLGPCISAAAAGKDERTWPMLLLLFLSSCSNKTGLSVPLVILIRSPPCPINLMVCLMKSHLKGLSPDPNRQIKLRPRPLELHLPAVVPPCSRSFLREPQRDRRAALPKSENTWPSRIVGDRVLVLPVVWRQVEREVREGGVRFEGSCRKGKLLGWILDLPLGSDLATYIQLLLALGACIGSWKLMSALFDGNG